MKINLDREVVMARFQVLSKKNKKRREGHIKWVTRGTRAIHSSRKELMVRVPGTGVASTGRGEPITLLGEFLKIKNLTMREVIKAREWAIKMGS